MGACRHRGGGRQRLSFSRAVGSSARLGSGVVPVLAAGRLLVYERALTGQGRAELATLLQTAAARAATPA